MPGTSRLSWLLLTVGTALVQACEEPHPPSATAGTSIFSSRVDSKPQSAALAACPSTNSDGDWSVMAERTIAGVLTAPAVNPVSRIVVLPMICSNGGVTALGFFWADKLAASIVKAKRCRVADRSAACDVLVENDLGHADLNNASITVAAVKSMARNLWHTDTFLPGVGCIDGMITLITGQIGELVAARDAVLPLTAEVRSMLVFVQQLGPAA